MTTNTDARLDSRRLLVNSRLDALRPLSSGLKEIAAGLSLSKLVCATLYLLVVLPIGAMAAEPPLRADQLLVDVVTLKSGSMYRGAVLQRSADGNIHMVVRREWLKRQSPKEADTLVAQQNQQTQTALQQLADRLDGWLKTEPENQNLVALLQIERDRIDQQLKSVKGQGKPFEPPQFVWLSFAEGQVRTSFLQAVATRKWAALAWQRELKDVERRSADDLRKELAGLGVTIDDPVNLSDRLPLQLQSDDEWAARRAMFEFRYGKRLEFQGLGDTWLRTDGNAAKADWKLLLPSILQSQLKAQLGDLLGDKIETAKPASAALSKAIEQAEAERVVGFRATELKLDIDRLKASVGTRLVVQIAPNRWVTLWQHTVEEDGSKARPEVERRIEADPQVKEVMGLLKGLDVGGNGNPATAAIRVGAAVMQAQQTANGEFQTFLDQYTRRLDGPPLSLQKP